MKFLDNLGHSNDFLDKTSNTWSVIEILDKMNFIKLKTLLQKTMSREWKNKTQAGRKYLQKTHLIKKCYPVNKKNNYTLIKMLKKIKLKKRTVIQNIQRTFKTQQ